MTSLSTRTRPAVLVAVCIAGVILISATSAVAVGLVTSAQIKDNTIQSRDVKNKTLKLLDIAPAARTALKGRSPWDTIPSGTTVSGPFRFELPVPAGGGNLQFAIALPGVAPAALLNATVNFQANAGVTDADAACTGTAATPTAPAGKVCLYLTYSGSGASAINGIAPPSGGDRGFAVTWVDDGADNDAALFGTWAYTAP